MAKATKKTHGQRQAGETSATQKAGGENAGIGRDLQEHLEDPRQSH